MVIGKMKDVTARVTIKEFVGLKPKMYSYLVDDNSEHKKSKSVNKNVVATIRNIKMFCWIRNMWEIQWIGFKLKTIE